MEDMGVSMLTSLSSVEDISNVSCRKRQQEAAAGPSSKIARHSLMPNIPNHHSSPIVREKVCNVQPSKFFFLLNVWIFVSLNIGMQSVLLKLYPVRPLGETTFRKNVACVCVHVISHCYIFYFFSD